MRIDSYSVINEDSHLMCRSQYANASGICAPGTRSLNKGKVCKNSTMCPSVENPNITAKCSCGWNANKTRYCNLLPGDDEWVEVRALFKTYYEATKTNCNTEARWERCSEPRLYNEWMCAKLKAENYAYMIDDGTLECMENLY